MRQAAARPHAACLPACPPAQRPARPPAQPLPLPLPLLRRAGDFHGLPPTGRETSAYGVAHFVVDTKAGRATWGTIWRQGFLEEREVRVRCCCRRCCRWLGAAAAGAAAGVAAAAAAAAARRAFPAAAAACPGPAAQGQHCARAAGRLWGRGYAALLVPL